MDGCRGSAPHAHVGPRHVLVALAPRYWRKATRPGHIQLVRGARLDCDGDALLIRVEQVGPACHTGTRTCFDADDLGPEIGPEPDAVT